MISKPIGLSPDNEVISITDDILRIEMHISSNSSIEVFQDENGNDTNKCYATLFMADQDNTYLFQFAPDSNAEHAPIIENGEHSHKIKFELPINEISGTYTALLWNEFSMESDTKFKHWYYERHNITLFDLVKKTSLNNYKIRLYDKNSILNSTSYTPNNIIGFGTIQNGKSDFDAVDKTWQTNDNHYAPLYKDHNRFGYSSSDTEDPSGKEWDDYIEGKILKIFPHTNIHQNIYVRKGEYWGNTTFDLALNEASSASFYEAVNKTQGTSYDIGYHEGTLKAFYNFERLADENVKYFINNRIIKYYNLYPFKYTAAIDCSTKPLEYNCRLFNLNTNLHFDSYGNPIAGYVSAKEKDGETDYVPDVGTSYKIQCNYIDSDWAYFQIATEPTITITDSSGTVISNYNSSSTNPLNLSSSSVDLHIDFIQEDGVTINYYSYKIYRYDIEEDEFILDYCSANRYNQNVKCSYNKFFNKNLYKIEITLVDTNQRVYEREIYYNTKWSEDVIPINVDVKYYRPHNSLIIDWSKLNSINPTSINGNYGYKYVADGDSSEGYVLEDAEGFMPTPYVIGRAVDEPKKSVYISEGSSFEYLKNDFGKKLKFNSSTFAVDFYGTDCTEGTIFELGCDDGFAVKVEYVEKRYLIVKTTEYDKIYDLYPSLTEENVVDNLKTELSSPSINRPSLVPFVWNNGLTWDTSYTWKIYNNISAKWRLVVSPFGAELIGLSGYCVQPAVSQIDGTLDNSASSYLKLYGDLIYDGLIIQNNSDDTFTEVLSDRNNWIWNNDTQFLTDFNGNISGVNLVGSLQGIEGFRVYKTLGNQPEMIEVAHTTATDSRILEDFVVGDNCDYQYHVYAIVNSGGVDIVLAAGISEKIKLYENTCKVFSLKEIGEKIYQVNLGQVWRLYLNLDDNGYTIKTDKTFYDTFNKYSQQSLGNRNYITKSVKGMLGAIDCKSGEIDDDYDMLVSWNNFVTSGNRKCLIDSRGLVLPGNFENDPSVEYLGGRKNYANANFNWRQLSDLKIIKIYGTLLPYNPVYNDITLLMDRDDDYLTSVEDKLLSSER